MATFTNFATLSYNGTTLNSNTVTGELLETVTVAKTVLEEDYGAGEELSYVISLTNTGDADVTGLTVTDDLGGYEYNGTTVYPLAYQNGTLRYFVNGALQPAPTVTAGPPLTVSGLSIPAGGNALLVYSANTTEYASPEAGAHIENTASVTGGGLAQPVTASASLAAAQTAELRINKAVSPAAVAPGGALTYTFTIENHGPEASGADLVMTDTFNPVLANLTVTFNGAAWTEGTNYSYAPATGLFSTLAGQLTVPAATYTQGADGAWAVTPGVATLSISGNVQPTA